MFEKIPFKILLMRLVNQLMLIVGGERGNSIKMHDRYLFTNQCGLVCAAGTNIDDRQQSEWSIKDYRELETMLCQYKPNSTPFDLLEQISTSW